MYRRDPDEYKRCVGQVEDGADGETDATEAGTTAAALTESEAVVEEDDKVDE